MSHEQVTHTEPTEIVDLTPHFNPRLQRKTVNGKREGVSGYLRHHLQLQVPEDRQDELIPLRHQDQAYVYRIDRGGEAVVDPTIFGTRDEVYGLPTRSLLNREVLFSFFGKHRNERWVLATFAEPTKTPPDRLSAADIASLRPDRSQLGRPVQVPARAS